MTTKPTRYMICAPAQSAAGGYILGLMIGCKPGSSTVCAVSRQFGFVFTDRSEAEAMARDHGGTVIPVTL